MSFAKSIVISGASRGIGAALAEFYAAPGVTLGLVMRASEAARQTAKRCQTLGAQVEIMHCDVTDREACSTAMIAFDAKHPIQLLIANAGVTGGIQADQTAETAEECARLIETNLIGAMNVVSPVLPLMLNRGNGQIGLVSSLGAFVGMPVTPAYCASKAGLKAWGEALRLGLANRGVKVNIICPGFVKTQLSDQFRGQKPGMIAPEVAAKKIAQGLSDNTAFIVFPFWLGIGMRLLGILPLPVAGFFLKLFGYHRAQTVT